MDDARLRLAQALELACRLSPARRAALVAGEVSGIQSYLRDAAARGADGAGRRLRFRSFLVALAARVTAIEILSQAGITSAADVGRLLLIDAGGYFLMLAPAEVLEHLPQLRARLDWECMRRTQGQLRIVIAGRAADASSPLEDTLTAVLGDLADEKLRPLSAALAPGNPAAWNPDAFRLSDPGGHGVCSRCGLPRASMDGGSCSECNRESEMGWQLGRGLRWRVARSQAGDGDWLGWSARPVGALATPPSGGFDGPAVPQRVPEGDFDDIARKAAGRPLLAYVKVDGDRIGELFSRKPLTERLQLSRRIDAFFREWLDQPGVADEAVYLVYGGGDDALFVAPWSAALDLTVNLAQAWTEHMRAEGATISAGVALHPPRFPLAFALDAVNRALERAKEHRNCLHVMGESLRWQEAAFLAEAWRRLHELVNGRGLPVSVLWALSEHLAGDGSAAADGPGMTVDYARRHLLRRGRLLYVLHRNAPQQHHPEFWRWVRDWLPFDAIAAEDRSGLGDRLRVLRLAVALALWSRPEREERAV